MIDEFFIESLKKENYLLCCFKNNILIEITFFGALNFLKQALFELQKLRLGKKELKEWVNIKISQQKIIGL
tara:strand:- start:166 stop:378 length:213 start_codon:yes stop_codon:yes gene_type:complete